MDKVSIWNRALRLCGATAVASESEDSGNANLCAAVYDEKRKSLLEKHDWNCAIKRVQLAIDTTDPVFGRTYRYRVPADFIRLVDPDPEHNSLDRDWQIEQNFIYTDELAPINVRYIYDLTDTSIMSPTFRELLAVDMALEMTEVLSQSNTKATRLEETRKRVYAEARKANAFQKVAQIIPDGSFITARLPGG